MTIKVDLIIPLKGGIGALQLLLKSIALDSEFVSKVIVVSSGSVHSNSAQNLEHDFPVLRSRNFIYQGLDVVVYKSAQTLMPGQARNIGISRSNASHIAFLDQNTIPSIHWLRNSIRLMRSHDYKVLCGSTRYAYDSYIQKLIIASSYGFYPLKTVPGSILNKNAFISLGYFLPNTRAAEDIAFIERVSEFYGAQPTHHLPHRTLTYTLQSSSVPYYFYKWFRNYKSSAPYTLLSLQQIALLLSLIVSLVLFSYSWNSLLARWTVESPLYIPFVSRITLALIVIAYVIVRGLWIPFKKGAYKSHRCNILDFPFILAISFLLDLSKSAALIYRLSSIGSQKSRK